MNDVPTVVEGPYLRDILDQPRALDATLRRLESSPALDRLVRRIVDGAYERIVLTGMGSSYHGLHPIHLRLVERLPDRSDLPPRPRRR